MSTKSTPPSPLAPPGAWDATARELGFSEECYSIIGTITENGKIWRQTTAVGLGSYQEVLRRIHAMIELCPNGCEIREFVVIHPVDTHTNVMWFNKKGERVLDYK